MYYVHIMPVCILWWCWDADHFLLIIEENDDSHQHSQGKNKVSSSFIGYSIFENIIQLFRTQDESFKLKNCSCPLMNSNNNQKSFLVLSLITNYRELVNLEFSIKNYCEQKLKYILNRNISKFQNDLFTLIVANGTALNYWKFPRILIRNI